MIYSEQDIIDASGANSGENLVLIDKKSFKKNILDKLNFVDSVTIKRKFPDTLQINVKESKMLAYIESGGKYYVINRRCRVLCESDAVGVAGYIEIKGAEAASLQVGAQLSFGDNDNTRIQYLADLMEALMNADMYQTVTWIDVSNVSSYKFQYKANLEVELGTNEKLSKKLDMLKNILLDLSENDKGTINLATSGEGHYIPE